MHFTLKIALVAVFIFEWLVRLAAFYVVPRNRKPSSATAWLMLIMVFPSIGLIIYLLVGSPKLSKLRRSKQRAMDYIIQNAVEEARSDPHLNQFVHFDVTDRIDHLVKLTTTLGGMPAFSGNKIDLFAEYNQNFTQIIDDINQAKQFVHVQFYIITLDAATRPLFHALATAVQRGVKVRVLFDAYASRRHPGYKAMKQSFINAGIDWNAMLPFKLPGKKFNRPDLRNHRKIIVIDDVVGYVGSQNIVTRNYHRKDHVYYDELMARVEGPVVAQLNATFITDWYSESNELLTSGTTHEIKMAFRAAGQSLAQVMPSGPGYDTNNNLKLFTTLIHAADSRIVIVNPYFVPDDSLMIAITSAAQRGVEVIMLNSEVIDQWLVGYAQRSYYEELLKAGVQVYLYNKPVLLHSKYITIDNDIAAIGSSNLDMRSFELDLEVTMMCYDKKTVAELNALTTGYLQKSHPVKITQWQARPFLTKLFENIARLTAAFQ